MKKISVKNFNLKDVEQLSRAELQTIVGGKENIPEGGSCSVSCDFTGNSCVTVDCKPGICVYSNRTIICTAH